MTEIPSDIHAALGELTDTQAGGTACLLATPTDDVIESQRVSAWAI